MKEIVVTPLKAVGDIEFGMSRNEVRGILGKYREFKKSKFSSNTTDDFGYCHVYYDKENKCEAVEIFDDVTVKIGQQVVFPLAFSKTCEILKVRDGNVEIEEGSCTSLKESIGVYAPQGYGETILFGCEGYYL